MTPDLRTLDFDARQAAKQAERQRDGRALREGTATLTQLRAKNYWFNGLRPEQISLDVSRTRELY